MGPKLQETWSIRKGICYCQSHCRTSRSASRYRRAGFEVIDLLSRKRTEVKGGLKGGLSALGVVWIVSGDEPRNGLGVGLVSLRYVQFDKIGM